MGDRPGGGPGEEGAERPTGDGDWDSVDRHGERSTTDDESDLGGSNGRGTGDPDPSDRKVGGSTGRRGGVHPDGDTLVMVVGDPSPPDADPFWSDGSVQEGPSVERAATVERARRLAATGRVDRVVVGTDPPCGDLQRVVDAVREYAPGVPVVLAVEGDSVPVEAVEAGVDDCLPRAALWDPEAFGRHVRAATRPVGESAEPVTRSAVSPADPGARTPERGHAASAGPTSDDEGRAGPADEGGHGGPAGGDGLSGEVARIGAGGEEAPESLTTLFETLPMPVAETVLVDDEPIVAAVNPAFERTFGYDAGAAVGESLDDLVVPEDRRESAAELTRRSAQGDRLDVRVPRKTTDGIREFILRFAPISVEDDPLRGYDIYVDVTDRAEYERVVTRLHEVTRDLMATETPEDIAEVGVTTAREILGFPYASVHLYDEDEDVLRPAAVTEPSLETFGPPPEVEPGEGIAGRAFRDGERVLLDDAQQHEGKREDGPTEIRSYCVIPVGGFGIMTISSPETGAIDERDAEVAGILAANVEAALRRADREARLRQRERELSRQNERLDRVASVMSHDLRNPIEVARANVHLAERDAEGDYLDDVEGALDRMTAIVEDALELARQGEAVVDPSPVEFESVVRAAWRSIDAGPAELRVETDLAFPADPGRLQRLLENLFRNAIEHAGPDVTVTVEATPDGFAVADDGPGIDPDEFESVFEPGYSTAPDGTGLGLNIAQEIARAHDWAIAAVESEAGARIEVTGIDGVDGED